MLEDLFKIDRSMGESRFAQFLGVVLIGALIVFAIYNKEITKWIKEVMQWV